MAPRFASSYVYDGANIVQELLGLTSDNGNPVNVKASYVSGGIDELFAKQSGTGAGAAILTYLTDALGSTVRLVDGAGNKVVDYIYDPYGNTSADAAVDNAFQYTGRENDGTGLYYYRARYYAPQLARLISSDPIGLGGGVNTYTYVDGNPLSFVDPTGLIRYNAPAPRTVPVSGATGEALQCVESCLQQRSGNSTLDLLITGGAEKAGHSSTSHHYKGEACDVSTRNPVNSPDVFSCAKECGFNGAQLEKFSEKPSRDHWHLQLEPGLFRLRSWGQCEIIGNEFALEES